MPKKSVSCSGNGDGSGPSDYAGILRVLLSAFILMFIATLAVPVSAVSGPTVTVLDYQVSPPVLLPDTLGTISITVKNTATSASIKENTGFTTSDPTTTTITDINVFIENVHLEGNGIDVLSNDFASGR